MSNPIRYFENLRDMYLRYLDSPFDLRYSDLVTERRQLLDQDGRIYRRPLIEPVPTYRPSDLTFSQIVDNVLGTNWNAAEKNDLVDFGSLNLFPPNRIPYTH